MIAFSVQLPTTAPGDSLLLLLIAGHLLADFAFQTRRMVQRKERLSGLIPHVAVVTVVHLVVLLPFADLAVLGMVVAIGLLHGIIDSIKARWPRATTGELSLFLADQLAHGLVLMGAFYVLTSVAGPLPVRLSTGERQLWELVSIVLGAFAFNWTGGAAIVSGVLDELSPGLEEAEEQSSGVKGSGRLIGELERTITLVLILLGQWAAIILLLAAKSIARFEELKERRFAEYYLVGTLSSLLVAILVGLALTAVV